MTNFVAYQIAIELIAELRPIVECVQKHDSNLADQMKRAATSVALNLSEGSRRVKGNQQRAYEIAHGEAREVLGCLDCAAAWGYVVDASRASEDRSFAAALLGTHAREAELASGASRRCLSARIAACGWRSPVSQESCASRVRTDQYWLWMSDSGEVRDLRSVVSGGPRLDPEPAIQVVIATCRAVARADSRRTIVPSRILISSSGEVILGDEDFTSEGIGYAAPEYSETPVSQHRLPDGSCLVVPFPEFEIDRPRAFVFALGCILWELLAGRRLFLGMNDYQTLELARAAQVPPLHGVAPELEAIVRQALAKDVERRYQSPLQFADALADYLVTRASS